jgi:inner membrane protein
MFLAWSQMPFATVKRQACAVTVTFGDARFATPLLAGSFTRQVVLPLQTTGC